MPLDESLAPKPSVSAADRITKAIEGMLKNDLRRIAVTNGGRVIGMVRLEDALKKVGLEEDLKSIREVKRHIWKSHRQHREGV